MAMTCTNRLIKQTMFVFNFIFVITGIIILGVGVSVKAHYYPYDIFLDSRYFSLPNMLIATGSLIFFISLLGCYGAIKENWVILMIFSVLLTVIFIFELSVGIAGYVLRNKTSDYLDTTLINSMPKYTTTPSITNMWDIIQEEFECCGVTNYSDWQTVVNSLNLPVSCCPHTNGIVGAFYCNSYEAATTTVVTTPTTTVVTTPTTTVVTSPTEEPTTESTPTESTTSSTPTSDPADPIDPIDPPSAKLIEPAEPTESAETTTRSTEPTPTYPPSSSTPYQIGCHSAFGNFVKSHAVDIGAVGIALAVIQLGGIFLSFHLARQLKNGYYST